MEKHKNKLNVRETMKSWGWRIKKAGMNLTTFGDTVEISQPMLGAYVNGTKTPNVMRYEMIENKLRDLGV